MSRIGFKGASRGFIRVDEASLGGTIVASTPHADDLKNRRRALRNSGRGKRRRLRGRHRERLPAASTSWSQTRLRTLLGGAEPSSSAAQRRNLMSDAVLQKNDITWGEPDPVVDIGKQRLTLQRENNPLKLDRSFSQRSSGRA